MKCTHVCAAQKTLYQIINKPDFPSLADEIAEPRPDMNIKVAAFTVSEKSSNTLQVYYRRILLKMRTKKFIGEKCFDK